MPRALFFLLTLALVSCQDKEPPADAKYVSTGYFLGSKPYSDDYLIDFHKDFKLCEKTAEQWAIQQQNKGKKVNYGCQSIKSWMQIKMHKKKMRETL